MLSRIWKLLCLLRIDIYYWLFLVGTSLISVPLNQMVQDKICLNDLQLGEEICDNLAASGPQYESAKNEVLEKATSIKNYQNLIATAPGIVFSLFIGRWIDLYPTHLRYILTLPCLGGAIQVSLLIHQTVNFDIGVQGTLYTFISYGLLGGDTLASIGAYTYVARKTPPEHRSLRFSVMELFRLSALPVASALGGKILSLQPWFQTSFRNYLGVFLVCLLTKIAAIIWTLGLIYDSDGKDQSAGSETSKTSTNQKSDTKHTNVTSTSTEGKSFLRKVLDPENIYLTLETFTRKRVNYGRAQLWHLTLAMSITFGILSAQNLVMFQFTQKVFHWDYQFYSYVGACLVMFPMLGKPIFTYLFIHRLHFSDATLSTFGCISCLIGFILKGAFLQPLGYYLGSIFLTLSGLPVIGMRSMITQIVDYNEIGQMYVINLAFTTAAPFLAGIFYTTIFKATLQSYPGMVFHAAGLVLLYPLCASLAMDFIGRRSDEKMTGQSQVTCIKRQSVIDVNLDPSSNGKNDNSI